MTTARVGTWVAAWIIGVALPAGCGSVVIDDPGDADAMEAIEGTDGAEDVRDDAGPADDAVRPDDGPGPDDAVRPDDGPRPDDAAGEDGAIEVPPTCGNGHVEGDEECDGDPPRGCDTSCDSRGVERCIACLWSECEPPDEECNGLDDDCDDVCDNGFACCIGNEREGLDGTCRWTQRCVDSCAWSSRNYGAPPANDTCSGALPIVIPGGMFGSVSLEGSTCAATPDFAPECGGVAPTPDVVYVLRLSTAQSVRIDTFGSTLDTVLWLGAGNACPGTPVACDDDDSGGGTASRIEQVLAPGTYWIVVDGKNGNRGSFQLNVRTDPAPVPGNDRCENAVRLRPSVAPQLERGTTLGATDDGAAGCPISPIIPLTAGPDVWYVFTPGPARHPVYLDLLDGQTWTGTLRILEGACDGPVVGCAGPACGTPRPQYFDVLGTSDGTSVDYYVAVDGAARADMGPFVLRYHLAPPTCSVMTPVRANGTFSGGLGTGSGGYSGTGVCMASEGEERMYGIALCPGRLVTAVACSSPPPNAFNPVLYLRQYSCANGATQVACGATDLGGICPVGSPGASLAYSGTAPGIYFLFMDRSAMGGAGSYVLTVGGL